MSWDTQPPPVLICADCAAPEQAQSQTSAQEPDPSAVLACSLPASFVPSFKNLVELLVPQRAAPCAPCIRKRSSNCCCCRSSCACCRFARLVSSRSCFRVAVIERHKVFSLMTPQDCNTPLRNSSWFISTSLSSCSSSLLSQRSNKPSFASRTSSLVATPEACTSSTLSLCLRNHDISEMETKPLPLRSTILKKCFNTRAFDLYVSSLSFCTLRCSAFSLSLRLSSMKMAGTSDMRAIDATKMKHTKKGRIPGFALAVRSTAPIQFSKVMSLNIVHMDAPRLLYMPATSVSEESHKILVTTIADTKTTNKTSMANFSTARLAVWTT
mmetsp:Transcript_46087/g.121697  ORF Transcript_46087/g.121697 Transcript_46087/m.121697 type:complete len:326 (-) Transcript_46087:418-1395(-)